MSGPIKTNRPFSAVHGYLCGGSTAGKSIIYHTAIERFTIKIPGITSSTFGALSQANASLTALASQKRGGRLLAAGGINPSGPTTLDTIEYIETRTGGAVTAFGVLSAAKRLSTSGSDANIGLVNGGFNGTSYFTKYEHVQISTAANATSYGDLVTGISSSSGYSDQRNIYTTTGLTNSGSLNLLQVKTLKNSGNARSFSGLWSGNGLNQSTFTCNSRVGLKVGGITGSTRTNQMQHIPLRSLSAAKQFGTLSTALTLSCSASSQQTALVMKGLISANSTNVVTYTHYKSLNSVNQFGTLGNAKNSSGGYGGS